jgi:hypothetical protein
MELKEQWIYGPQGECDDEENYTLQADCDMGRAFCRRINACRNGCGMVC